MVLRESEVRGVNPVVLLLGEALLLDHPESMDGDVYRVYFSESSRHDLKHENHENMYR